MSMHVSSSQSNSSSAHANVTFLGSVGFLLVNAVYNSRNLDGSPERVAKKRTCKRFSFDSYASATTPQKCFLLILPKKKHWTKPHGVNKIWTIAGWFRWNENYYYCCCCATVTNQQKYTYGSEIFVSFPIMSTKLLSQSFFFSKSKFSTDNIICSARQKNNSAIEKIDREWVRKTEGIETKTQYQHKTPKNVPHKNFVCFCLF